MGAWNIVVAWLHGYLTRGRDWERRPAPANCIYKLREVNLKAIRIHFTDNGNELRMEEVPQPDPKSDEVRIRTQAIGVNRADLGRRRTVAEGEREPTIA